MNMAFPFSLECPASKALQAEAAASELRESVGFYAMESELLGHSFKAEVNSAIRRILQFPKGWSMDAGGIRKWLLQKFPYKILYSIEKKAS